MRLASTIVGIAMVGTATASAGEIDPPSIQMCVAEDTIHIETQRETRDWPQIEEEMESMIGGHGGQCVEFIQRYFNTYYSHPDFRGNARDIQPNVEDPEVGDIVLTQEKSGLGHVSLIIEMDEETLTLIDSNFKLDETVEVGRTIARDNYKIRGYYRFYGLE